jgi:hypothetical protein
MKVIYSGERQPRMVVLTQVRSREAVCSEMNLCIRIIDARLSCGRDVRTFTDRLRELCVEAEGIADGEGKG